jgi:hypothetical protein
MTEDTLVIPGHGSTVDRTFVQAQRDEVNEIVETVQTLAGLGVPADRAVADGEWPWEADFRIRNAVSRGYEALESARKAEWD